MLVVLLHVGLAGFSGGFVGVDVFFVISGFVITRMLLEERISTGRLGVLDFYGRRARRIIPAAVLVILVTVLFERLVLGIDATRPVASDARWDAIFFANLHLTSLFGHHAAAPAHAAPLTHYWSLAVEEQFYLVFPAMVLFVAAVGRRLPLRQKLGVSLVAVIVASFMYSVTTSPLAAYAAPLARAWELAVGALVACAVGVLHRVPRPLAGALTWLGLGGVIVSAVTVKSVVGTALILPVGATGLVIAGGTAAPALGAETVLRTAPMKWLGRWSYSLYLWHYPILVIAAQYWRDLTVVESCLLALGALGLSAATYFLVENPVRNSRFFRSSAGASLAAGAFLVLTCLGLVTAITWPPWR
jgi:peptidoglycan/LPS O-acetylase OafA/YrhL